MTTKSSQTKDFAHELVQKPDWIVKNAKGYGRDSRLTRIGTGWTRDDGGICLRLVGTQVVDGDIYLYPAQGEVREPDPEHRSTSYSCSRGGAERSAPLLA